MICPECNTPLKKCLKCGKVYCSKCDTHGSGHDGACPDCGCRIATSA